MEEPSVLVVDDHAALLVVMSEAVRLAGFRVRAALGPEEALALLRGGPPFDAVVADYQLPGLDGLAFMSSVHAWDPALQCLVISGSAEPELAERAVSAGALSYLQKPFSMALLRESVARAVAVTRERRAGIVGH
jgi:DNA-binding NtrC family response regulator